MIQSHVFKALRWLPHATVHTPAPPSLPDRTQPRVVMIEPTRPRLSIHRHPDDLRRTVISGRFAEVCAALEGLAAAELEAA
jgi:hypothetical protein